MTASSADESSEIMVPKRLKRPRVALIGELRSHMRWRCAEVRRIEPTVFHRNPNNQEFECLGRHLLVRRIHALCIIS